MRPIFSVWLALCFAARAEALKHHHHHHHEQLDAVRFAEECGAGRTVDCTVTSEWSTPPNFGFGPCSTTCGQGTSTRTRSVIHAACNNGKPCPPLTQTDECMARVCECEDVHCKVRQPVAAA
jgi:hypothetical protein